MSSPQFYLVGFFAIFTLSCNSPSSSLDKNQVVAEKAGQIINTSKNTTLLDAPTASHGNLHEEKLNLFFTEPQLAQLKNVEKLFNAIKSAEDLASFYRNTLPEVLTLMAKKINQYDPENTVSSETPSVEKWKWFNYYMPYISVELFCSECGVEAYIVINPLRDKAELTPEKIDDLFFDALLTTYDNQKNKEKICDKAPNNWVALVNCDLCGTSVLGNDKHLNTLKAIEQAQKIGILFDKELIELHQQAIPYQTTNYYLPKSAVLEELGKIINLTSPTKKEKETLKNIRYLISTSKDMQFDCQKGNCQFLAM